jgi:hypothetical protein
MTIPPQNDQATPMLASIEGERYADSIIDDPKNYTAIEVHPCTPESYGENDIALQIATKADDPIVCWSTYAHLVCGGIDCIGDFQTAEEALTYGQEIAEKYGWSAPYFYDVPQTTEELTSAGV